MTTPRNGRRGRRLVLFVVACMVAAMLSPFVQGGRAFALAVNSAAFAPNGQPGSAIVNGITYAGNNRFINLNVNFSPDVRCMGISGAHSRTLSFAAGTTSTSQLFQASFNGVGMQSVFITVFGA